MTNTVSGDRVRRVLAKRVDALAALAGDRLDKPALVDELGVSRSTVDRAVAELETTGFARRAGAEFEATQAGELALETHREYTVATDALGGALPLLAALPDDAPVGAELLNGGSVDLAEAHAPEGALSEVVARLPEADTLRGFAPVVKTNYVSMLHDQVVAGDLDVEIIVQSGALDSLRSIATARGDIAAFVEHEAVSILETDEQLPYALWLLEAPEFQRAGLTVHQNGAIVGVLTNDRPAAFDTCSEQYATVRERAERFDPAAFD